MITQGQMQEAVRLADGWSLMTEFIARSPKGYTYSLSDMIEEDFFDLISAQLIRQIDEMENYAINVNEYGASVTFTDDAGQGTLGTSQGRENGRSVNAILAILDAGVA